MRSLKFCFWLFIGLALASCEEEGVIMEEQQDGFVKQDYPIVPISFKDVHFQDSFWLPKLLLHREKTLPYTLDQCEQTGRINNFRRAADKQEGSFCTIYPFDDSDVFKIIEGAAYSLQVAYDANLDARLDSLIDIIAQSQEEDGYLYTNRTINPDSTHEWAGSERWQFTHILSHELYNMGHLYEAAAAHYWATGKRNLLDIALKNADLIDKDFGWGKLERPAGHQVIEMGLAKLYRITGEAKYLKLAQFFLDVRGPGGDPYSQAHLKVVDQRKAVGHAVRALYMYSGMADIAALTQNKQYIAAIDSIWEDVVTKKIYVTGGIGATGENEGFAGDYELPNYKAYCETCASIANIFWNHRLFLLHGEAKFIDVLERTLYNALSSGLSLSGDRFFYPNPLEADKNRERSPWFNCACCPSNLARFLPSIPGYQYAKKKDSLFVNLFVGGLTNISLGGNPLEIKQETRYPWDGNIVIRLGLEKTLPFNLLLRIPGWAQGKPIPGDLYAFANFREDPISIKVNGKAISFEIHNGYAVINRKWRNGDFVELNLPMPINKVIAHPNLKEDLNHFAFQRGPIIYCIEGQDQKYQDVRHYLVPLNASVRSTFEPNLLEGVQTIDFEGMWVQKKQQKTETELVMLKGIPYYSWANRGKDYMVVWLPYGLEYARPAEENSIIN